MSALTIDRTSRSNGSPWQRQMWGRLGWNCPLSSDLFITADDMILPAKKAKNSNRLLGALNEDNSRVHYMASMDLPDAYIFYDFSGLWF